MPAFYHQNMYVESQLDNWAWRTIRESFTDATHYMDSSHAFFQVLDGTNAAVYLPDATSLNTGHRFYFANETSNVVGAINHDGTYLTALGPNSRGLFILNDNTTSAGDWIYEINSASALASYSIFGYYGGNANTGRYMEIYPGTSSSESPYIVVAPLAIVAVTLGTSALNTGTMGIFKSTDLVNPLTTISLTNEDRKIITGIFIPVAEGDRISMRVTSGTFNKPYITLYFTGI